MIAVRQAEPRDAQAAADVLRRSITELCALDHRGDADTLGRWLANKTRQNFLSWLGSDDNFCVVAKPTIRWLALGFFIEAGKYDFAMSPLAPSARASAKQFI